ncbi:MAG: hypothetical protein WDM92_09765 [Caulobacteraceae bacterium]
MAASAAVLVQRSSAVAQRRRPRGVLAIGLSCIECAMQGRREHLPTSEEYPDHLVKRISFPAGDGLGWTLSALWSPRAAPPPWKIVVVTGAPSWARILGARRGGPAAGPRDGRGRPPRLRPLRAPGMRAGHPDPGARPAARARRRAGAEDRPGRPVLRRGHRHPDGGRAAREGGGPGAALRLFRPGRADGAVPWSTSARGCCT